MRNQQLFGETAINGPARLRRRRAQLLYAAPTITARAVRPAGINQNVTGSLQVTSDLMAKDPGQRAADDAIDHVQV